MDATETSPVSLFVGERLTMQHCRVPEQPPSNLPGTYATETTIYTAQSLQVTPSLRRKSSSQTSVPFARDLATPPVSQLKHRLDRSISEQAPNIRRCLSTDSDGDDRWSTMSSDNGHQMDEGCSNSNNGTPLDECWKSSESSGEEFEAESTESDTSCLLAQQTLDTLSTHSIAGSRASSFERRRDEVNVLPARRCAFYLAFGKKRAHAEQKIKKHLERVEWLRKSHRYKRVQESSNPQLQSQSSESSKLLLRSSLSADVVGVGLAQSQERRHTMNRIKDRFRSRD